MTGLEAETIDYGTPLARAEYERMRVAPFDEFDAEKQADINDQCRSPRPPPKWLKFFLCQMVSRAYFEWFIRRGRDPRRSREKVPPIVRDAVARRDNMVCGICKQPIASRAVLHIDHIVPVSLGGKTILDNLRAAHAVCNMRRGNRVEAGR